MDGIILSYCISSILFSLTTLLLVSYEFYIRYLVVKITFCDWIPFTQEVESYDNSNLIMAVIIMKKKKRKPIINFYGWKESKLLILCWTNKNISRCAYNTKIFFSKVLEVFIT